MENHENNGIYLLSAWANLHPKVSDIPIELACWLPPSKLLKSDKIRDKYRLPKPHLYNPQKTYKDEASYWELLAFCGLLSCRKIQKEGVVFDLTIAKEIFEQEPFSHFSLDETAVRFIKHGSAVWMQEFGEEAVTQETLETYIDTKNIQRISHLLKTSLRQEFAPIVQEELRLAQQKTIQLPTPILPDAEKITEKRPLFAITSVVINRKRKWGVSWSIKLLGIILTLLFVSIGLIDSGRLLNIVRYASAHGLPPYPSDNLIQLIYLGTEKPYKVTVTGKNQFKDNAIWESTFCSVQYSPKDCLFEEGYVDTEKSRYVYQTEGWKWLAGETVICIHTTLTTHTCYDVPIDEQSDPTNFQILIDEHEGVKNK